jgi:hypothetical protein
VDGTDLVFAAVYEVFSFAVLVVFAIAFNGVTHIISASALGGGAEA